MNTTWKRNAIGWAAAVLLSFRLVNAAPQETPNPRAQQQEVQSQINKLNDQLQEIRAALNKTSEVMAAQKEVDQSRAAYEQKTRSTPSIVGARKAAEDARMAQQAVTDEQATHDPDVVAAQKALDANSDEIDDLESDLRVARFLLGEARHKAARDPDLKKSAAGVAKLSAALQGMPAHVPALAVLMKDRDSARKEALSTTRPTAAQRDAVASADAAFDDGLKRSTEIQAAKAERDAAQKNYDEQVQAKAAAGPAARAQLAKIKEIEQKLAEVRTARHPLEQSVGEARAKMSKQDSKVASAHESSEVAELAYRKAIAADAADEQAAVEKSQQAYNKLIDAKLAADPKAAGIRKERDALSKQYAQLISDTPRTAPGPATKPAKPQ